MEPLYIIDGSGYIFRAFYAVAPLSNSQGLPTNALVGFSRMLAKLIKDFNAQYIAVTFDTKEPTFRHEMYPLYKANRAECPQELIPQLPYFRKVVEAFGIKSLEKPGVEADDIIATLARHFAKVGQEVVVVSGDKDLLQLVGENIKVYDAMKDVRYSEPEVKSKMGVWPNQVRDYLALIGDSSDNVPGVKGIGPKTAEVLFQKFSTLEGILNNLDQLEKTPDIRGAKSVKEKLEQNKENLKLSYELVGLKEDVPPFTEIKDIEELKWKNIQAELITPLFQELEFTKFLATLPLGIANTIINHNKPKEKKYTILNNDNFSEFVKNLSAVDKFAFDTETTSLNVYDAKLCGISFSWKDKEAYYLPLIGENAITEEYAREKLNPIFSSENIKKIGQNIKYDMAILHSHQYQVNGVIFDTMLASHLLHPDKRQMV